MKTIYNLVTGFIAFCCLAQAGVIHIDIETNDDGNVVIDADIGTDGNKLHHLSQSQHNAFADFDVKLPYEIHRGFLSDDKSYVKFSNIPYAEPPFGERRFKAPVPITEKSTEVNEGDWEAVCPQYQVGWLPKALDFLNCYAGALQNTCSFKDNWTEIIDPSTYPSFDGSGAVANSSEDCLLLDVYVPKSVWDNKSKKVPVVAWIHGGGFIYGWKSQAGGPEPLLKAAKAQNKDIIYVAMNYRLGAFGFLNGKQFISEGGTPNAGLHDQRLALSWIQDYIDLFGGDKSSVTVMGQSAGGSSILHHITAGAGAAALKPNFSQAILQSPAFLPEAESSTADQVYNELKVRLSSRSLSQLQQKYSSQLQVTNAIMTYFSRYGLFKFGPGVDDDYVPRLPGQLLLNNTYHKGIPMILGHTALDGLLFSPMWIRSDDQLEDYWLDLYPYTPEKVLDTMKKDDYYHIPDKSSSTELSKINAVFDLLDDVAISCNNHYLTNAILKNDSSTPVWRYLFSAKPAIHGSDVPFTYYPTNSVPPFVVPKMAQFMQQKYINFALTGNPNGGEDLVWPRYEEKVGKPYRSVMKFGDLLLGNFSSVIVDPLSHKRCDLWQDAPFVPSDDWMLRKQEPAVQFEL